MAIDPSPFTYGELAAMHEANQRSAWNHTGAVLAMLHNVNRGKGSKAKEPQDFNPYATKSKGGGGGIPLTKENLHMLKDLRGVRSADNC